MSDHQEQLHEELEQIRVALHQMASEAHTAIKGGASLLRMNQPQGFDCPGCAWPDGAVWVRGH
jgi:hypothetical protein